MAFHTTRTSEDIIKEQGGEYISTSGIYDVKIDFVSLDVNEHGARSLNFNIDYKGSKITLYNLRLDNNNGSENFGFAIFDKLCIIAGLESIDDPEEQTHPVGKEKTLTNFKVLDQFSGLNVKIRLQYVYSRYDGKIREQREIRSFYRAEDGSTAGEIINNTEPGIQLAKDLKYAQAIKYKDGLTPQDIEEWKASKAKSKSSDTAQPVTRVSAKSNPFNKK